MVWLVHRVDWSSPYVTASEPTSFTRKGSTGTSTVFAVCANRMIANGPQRRERGAQFSGLKDLVKPSGRLIVTGTQIASSSSSRRGIVTADRWLHVTLTRCDGHRSAQKRTCVEREDLFACAAVTRGYEHTQAGTRDRLLNRLETTTGHTSDS